MYCPILILHDRDDEIISFELGEKVSVKMCIAPCAIYQTRGRMFHPIFKHRELG